MSTKKISRNDFMKSIQKLRATEKRGSFYDMAINLINNCFSTEAYIIILATWNFGHFRYALRDFDINEFEREIKKLQTFIDRMKNEKIQDINFDNYKDEIEKIYTTLAQIKGVKYTGASKVMHLMNPNVFVMWDNYIRGQKSKKYYQKLNIFKMGYWCPKRYGYEAKDYLQFLIDMQNLFGHLNHQDNTRTFAKAIDEYNYWNISRPIRKMQEDEKRDKRK